MFRSFVCSCSVCCWPKVESKVLCERITQLILCCCTTVYCTLARADSYFVRRRRCPDHLLSHFAHFIMYNSHEGHTSIRISHSGLNEANERECRMNKTYLLRTNGNTLYAYTYINVFCVRVFVCCVCIYIYVRDGISPCNNTDIRHMQAAIIDIATLNQGERASD